MSTNISSAQKNGLDGLGDHIPVMGKTAGEKPALLGSALEALGPITSADAIDLPTTLTLLNEIKAKINAALAAAAG